ncbi:MAG: hypothetical protein ACOH2A_02275 [Sphingobacteriaceae bacterium]
MTFEEFFGKKKINLVALAEQEPVLFAEFLSHYGVMGPKSFDHTKKYWFNELRRRFPVPKEEKIILTAVNSETVVNNEVTATPAFQIEKQGFKPMFNRRAAFAPAAEQQPEKALPADATGREDSPAKPAYIPKFKPPVKAISTTEAKSEQDQRTSAQQNTPDIPLETPNLEIKPAYKPRFNAAINIKKETPAQPAEANRKDLASQIEPAKTTATEQVPQTDKPVVKPAYKPRFNAAINTKKENLAQPAEEKVNDLASPTEPAEITPPGTSSANR